jgi:hypothetical protein
MDDELFRFHCETPEQFVRSVNLAKQCLPPDVRSAMDRIRQCYLSQFGLDRTMELLHNRTIEQVMEEFESRPIDEQFLAEGERDGLTFRLSEPRENE